MLQSLAAHELQPGDNTDERIPDETQSTPYLRYSHVIAADVASADAIGCLFGYTAQVQPLQIDLLHLIEPSPADGSPEALTQRALKHLLTKDVAAIYHVAGCVDTRESPSIRHRLFAINAHVTSALATLAATCGVSRFVLVSSASAVHTKLASADRHIPFYFRMLPRPSMLSQKWSVSVPSSSISSYSASKLEGEQKVLQVGSSGGNGSLRMCIIRPHVIWGAHDPLSTEMLLSWPRALPLILIGDLDSQVVPVRVDNVAHYIMMADAALFKEASFSGQVFNVGDERVTLGHLHARIVMLGREMRRRQAGDSLQQKLPQADTVFHVESRNHACFFSFGCLRRVECTVSSLSSSSSSEASASMVESFWVVIIPKCIIFVMLLVMEIIDVCFGYSRLESCGSGFGVNYGFHVGDFRVE